MKVSFYCRKSKENRKGLSPIYAKIKFQEQFYEKSTSIRCVYENWDPITETIKGCIVSTEALKNYKSEVFEYKKTLDRKLKHYEFDDFKKFFGKDVTTLDVLKEFKVTN